MTVDFLFRVLISMAPLGCLHVSSAMAQSQAPIALQAILNAPIIQPERCGWSVAISGDTAVIGAPSNDSTGTGVNPVVTDDKMWESGAAYIFVRDGANWVHQATLKASNTGAYDDFGCSVAISGDTVVVGARYEDGSGKGVNPPSDDASLDAGAAYVYTRRYGLWTFEAILKGGGNSSARDSFGTSVAVSGTTVAVGAPFEGGHAGAVYVFVPSGSTWVQQAYLKGNDTGRGDRFGETVSIHGDSLAVGAPHVVRGGDLQNNKGAAYVFVRVGTIWTQQVRLQIASEGTAFGKSASISQDSLVVGAPNEPDGGAAYVYVRTGATWGQQAILRSSNGQTNDWFGSAVAISGNTIAVGASEEDGSGTGINPPTDELLIASGAGYIFNRTGSSWTQAAYIKATESKDLDRFGHSVAASGVTALIGGYFVGKGHLYSPGPLGLTLTCSVLPRLFVEGKNTISARIPVDPDLILTSTGVSTLSSGSVTISEGFQNGQDVLGFISQAGMGNIVGSYNGTLGVLTLNSPGGTATVAEWQAALRTVTYTNASENPSTATRTIMFIVNDGVSNSSPSKKVLDVEAVADAPTNISLSATTVSQTAGSSAVVGTFAATDPDSTAFTYSLISGTGSTHNQYFSVSGSTLRANAAAMNAGSYSIRVRVSDGSNGFEKMFDITVTAGGVAHDMFADARALLDAGDTALGTNVGASGEAGEPTHVNASGTNSSVWFRWRPSASGVVQIDTIGSSFDTVMAIYTGSSVTSLSKVGDDDDSGEDGTSKVTFSAISGVVYYIAVGSYGSSRGVINLNARVISPTGTAKSPQTITFAPPPFVSYGDDAFLLSANASSGLPVAFELVSSVPANIASLSGSNLTINGAGTVTIRASQAGSIAYKPATSATRTIVIQKAVLTVTFAPTSRLVRQPNPMFMPLYTGFVNGDDSNDLATSRPVGRTNAGIASTAGNYPIYFSGGLDKNYRFIAGPPTYLTVVGFGGAYEAILMDSVGTALGKLELLVPGNTLSYTGVLHLASEPAAVPVAGVLAASSGAFANGFWSRGSGSLGQALNLNFQIGDGNALSAEISVNGSMLSGRSEERLYAQPTIGGKRQNAPWMGAHTLVLRDVLPLVNSNPRVLPRGAGHATVAIAATGVLTAVGRLADGTPLMASAKVDSGGVYRLFVRPYGRRTASFLAGELALRSHPNQNSFPGRYFVPESEGKLDWAKAALSSGLPDKSYRDGFAATVGVALDPWLPPLKGGSTLAQRLGVSSVGGAIGIGFSVPEGTHMGESAEALPRAISLSSTGAFTVAGPLPNVTGFTLTPTPATGAFTGTFKLSDLLGGHATAINRKVTFSGTLRQGPDNTDETIAVGNFLFDPVVNDVSNEQVSGELKLQRSPWFSADGIRSRG